MKRFFALYVVVMLLAASASYASLASALRSDTLSSQWGYLNGNRNCIWFYYGPGGLNGIYSLHGNYVTGAAVWAPPGSFLSRTWINRCLGIVLDRQGQYWVQTGPYNWVTSDSRLVATERLNGSYDTLFISYWNSPQPHITQRPKGRPQHKPQELLPPVEESNI
jgi:hypothetical protein